MNIGFVGRVIKLRDIVSHHQVGHLFPKTKCPTAVSYCSHANVNTSLNDEILQTAKKKRRKKYKIALAMGYCGKNYRGMQRGAGIKSIEEELHSALLKGSFISSEEYMSAQLFHFQRASRTDKGVSAVKQIVSFLTELSSRENFVKELNSHLPPDIRAYGFKITKKRFDCKKDCDCRTYSYLIPTFAFTPINEKLVESYRIPDSVLTTVNETLQMFTGRHKFHNFTAKMEYNDRSCSRKMQLLKCDKPFVRKNMEFVLIQIKGESFMLHQIRKMIGLTVAIVRGIVPPSIFSKCLEDRYIDIPRAPANGLFLEEVHYDKFNLRFAGDGILEPLLWDEHKDSISEIKELIISSIVEVEISEKSMFCWLDKLLHHTYDDMEFPTQNDLGYNWIRCLKRTLELEDDILIHPEDVA